MNKDGTYSPISPEDHHYVFAHYALRQFAFANPVEVFAFLEMEAEALVEDLLNRIAEVTTPAGALGLCAAEISCSCHLIQGQPCAIVTMPMPQHPAEAFLVAVWSKFDHASLDTGRSSAPIGYYTLEVPTACSSDEPSIFCSWDSDGRHWNYGTGPNPTVSAFLGWLSRWDSAQQCRDWPLSRGNASW